MNTKCMFPLWATVLVVIQTGFFPVWASDTLEPRAIWATEEHMDQQDFFFHLPVDMNVFEEKIYVLDQFEHRVLVFDLKGQFLYQFGENGRGPGEWVLPNILAVGSHGVAIWDNRFTIHFHDTDGAYRNRIGLLEPLFEMDVIGDKIVGLAIHLRGDQTIQFVVYDMDGNKLVKHPLNLTSRFDNIVQTGRLRFKPLGDQIMGLQVHGDGARLLDLERGVVERFDLSFNPLDEPIYQETNYQYGFQDFVIDGDRMIAAHPQRGYLGLAVFDRKGILKDRMRMPMFPGEMVAISRMELVEQGDRRSLIMLINQPESRLIAVDWPKGSTGETSTGRE